MASADGAPLRIEVVWGPEDAPVQVVQLELHAGATVADALAASGLMQHPAWPPAPWKLGVWGRACGATQGLRDRDRVEVYRALRVDPKEARRQRYGAHREKLKAAALSGTRKR